MISSCCSIVSVSLTRDYQSFRIFTQVRFVFLFSRPTLKKRRSKSLGQFVSTAREQFRIRALPLRVIECFLRKSPTKNDFQSITEEPKYQAKALTVVTDTIKKNWLIAGAAVVVTIPSTSQYSRTIVFRNSIQKSFFLVFLLLFLSNEEKCLKYPTIIFHITGVTEDWE